MLEFVRGNPQNPSGNLIAWCKVIGVNPIESDARFIACNIVVSLLDAREQNFPVVVFPPIAVGNRYELKNIFSTRREYDIVRIDDYEQPGSIPESKYIEDRLEDLNRQVVEYVELCREAFENREPWARMDVARGVRSSEVPQNISDEEHTLIKLERSLADNPKPLFVHELPRILQYMQTRYPQYDAGNMLKVIEKNDGDLARLYLLKFKAIFNEEYEQAARLHSQIKNRETIG
ncbi:MAG: hypothetical protein KDK39_00510 [Leptospiraceae bacterium]|nr:hypothetical protein [Leptospiraceae bacterium]